MVEHSNCVPQSSMFSMKEMRGISSESPKCSLIFLIKVNFQLSQVTNLCFEICLLIKQNVNLNGKVGQEFNLYSQDLFFWKFFNQHEQIKFDQMGKNCTCLFICFLPILFTESNMFVAKFTRKIKQTHLFLKMYEEKIRGECVKVLFSTSRSFYELDFFFQVYFEEE